MKPFPLLPIICVCASLGLTWAHAGKPATPATPATPADPGQPGTPATPANPATPAKPGNPPITTPVKFRNNGWGNGDQEPPGNSGPHNQAENSDRDPPPGIVKKFSSSGELTEDANYEAVQKELSRLESEAPAKGNSAAARRTK